MDNNGLMFLLWFLVLLMLALVVVAVVIHGRQRFWFRQWQHRDEQWRASPALLIELDRDGRVLDFSQVTQGFVLEPQLLFSHLLDERTAELFYASLERARIHQRPQRLELTLPGSQGPSVWMARLAPIASSGRLLMALVNTDHLVQQIQDAERARLAAEHSNLARARFLANMSHEIRTPMTGVLGTVSLLDQTELTPEQRGYQQVIHSSSEHLLAIINDILDLSKIDAGKVELVHEVFDVTELVDNLVTMMAHRAREKQLVLQSSVDPNLPRLLVGDAHRIRQVLINYLNNAIKFTDHGHVLLKLQLVSRQEDSVRLCFRVEDSGIGISTDRAASLFDEYTFAHGNLSREAGGSGLGLNICKRLAAMMKGEVGVLSTPGRGSTFWFDLNLPVAATVSETIRPEPTLTAGRVLWICDELEINRSLLLVAGRQLGMKTREFSRSEDLMRVAASQCPDVVIVSRRQLNDAGEAFRHWLAAGTVRGAMSSLELVQTEPAQLLAAGIGACWEWPISNDRLASLLTRLLEVSWPPQQLLVPVNRQPPAASPVCAEPFAGRRVLLAEDNPVNQKVARQMLVRLGCDVEVVGNGQEALQRAQAQVFDLILMDCHMPVMDGLEACRQIRAAERQQQRPAVPIVALSADVMADRKAACEDAGMNGYLSKPVRLEDLRRELPPYLAASEISELSSNP